jgi:hypothetical protein
MFLQKNIKDICVFSTVKYKGQLIMRIVQGQLFQLE